MQLKKWDFSANQLKDALSLFIGLCWALHQSCTKLENAPLRGRVLNLSHIAM